MNPLLAIVGRPNVGKSTLFNRLVGERKAITDNTSGVTRDRHYGASDWGGRTFMVVDTGGFVPHSQDVFEAAIREQVKIAIDEAHAILFMVDAQTGITGMDQDMAALLRTSTKPVVLVVNKIDDTVHQPLVHEFHGLGLGEPWALSAISGSGSGDLLDHILALFPPEADQALDAEHAESDKADPAGAAATEPESAGTATPNIPRIAIIGKPNVGKSSLLNALTGQERNIVTPIPGTTRDSIHTHFKGFGHDVLLIDTAGLRKKAKVEENLEFYSVMRTIKAIEESDVCLIMLDATQGIEAQDLSILNLAERRQKGVVLVINKWDLVEKDTQTADKFKKRITERVAPFTDVPQLFVSVHEKQRLLKILDQAREVYKNRAKRIATSKLNEFLKEALASTPPPSYRGNPVRIKYVTQIPGPGPRFAFFCNYPEAVKESYRRYMENRLREKFNFHGVPLRLFFRKK